MTDMKEYDPMEGRIIPLDMQTIDMLAMLSHVDKEENDIKNYHKNKNVFPRGLRGEQRRVACIHCALNYSPYSSCIDSVVECRNCDFVGFPCMNCATYFFDRPEWGCT